MKKQQCGEEEVKPVLSLVSESMDVADCGKVEFSYQTQLRDQS